MPSERPAKPNRTREELRAREADRLRAIRLKMAIHRALDGHDIIIPSDIGAALHLPAAEAVALLNRKRLREGDMAQLEEAATCLGVQVPG